MEKKPKSFTAGVKRKRKTSLRGAVSESKNQKLDVIDVPPINLDYLTKTTTNKIKNIPEVSELDKSPSPSKNMKKPELNVENNETVEKEDKKKKKNKHSDILKAKSTSVAKQIKKKKEKLLVAEVNTLKSELGVPVTDVVEIGEKSQKKRAKSPPKVAVTKFGQDSSKLNTDEFPILKDKELIDRFLKVPLTNNQKGRIRQAIKYTLQGSTTKMFPEIINGKIQALLSSATDLTDSELRRIRILYNMLKTSLETPEELVVDETTPPKKKDKKKNKEDGKKDQEDGKKDKEGGKKEQNKVKGPKRYVVFIGNLPLNITKEKIMEHFREFDEHVVDVRLPKPAPDKKSAIAFVELANEPSYELALSKHHSMLGPRRINVLYSTQQKSKISKAEAKGKSAKLIALQKAGKLLGSIPASKKRSHRRNIMKKARAKETAETA